MTDARRTKLNCRSCSGKGTRKCQKCQGTLTQTCNLGHPHHCTCATGLAPCGSCEGRGWNPLKYTIVFIINGQNEDLYHDWTAPLSDFRARILRASHNVGRAWSEWTIRDEMGERLDPESSPHALGMQDGKRLFLSLDIGPWGV